MSNQSETIARLTENLAQRLGGDGLTRDPGTLALMGQDIWKKGQPPAFVAAPATISELCEVVREAHQAGVPLNPRGGGMSYTNGYTPDREGIGLIDFRRLSRIVEINEGDMTVTVEAGCTWKSLHGALSARGLRTPFWGPLSGISSTIGGGLSQNNAFFGAGTYGPTSESVVSVTVVLADGTLIRTGTAAIQDGKPFFRHYGPDLTGLFLGDAGALGHKAEATFRLIRKPEAEDYASFEFATRDACAEAMREVGKEGLASELFGFDPNLTEVRLQRASLASDAKTLGKVVLGQGNLLKGLREGAKMATAGRKFLGNGTWSLHLVVEGRSDAGVRMDLDRLRRICSQLGGKEVANTIPKVIRANPFTPLNNMLGPRGERWVPIHGIVSMADGPKAWREIADAFDRMESDFQAHQITTGFLITTLSNNGYLIEPVFLWPEKRFAIHETSVERSFLDKLQTFPENPSATAVVERARQTCLDIFEKYSAAHFQIGRTYRYKDQLRPEVSALLERIKGAVDENGLVNPGALGLARKQQPIPVRNPRTGRIDEHLIPASREDIKALAERQSAASEAWQALSLDDRGERLLSLAETLIAHADEIAEALEQDTGRRRIARLEVSGLAASIEGWVKQIPHLLPDGWQEGRQNPSIRHRPQFVPYGRVGVISPWNFPLTLSMIDTVPALLAGSTVIVKPSEVTPRFVRPLSDAIRQAGLDHVLGFVQGGGQTGAALIAQVDAVCFTGSVATGKKVARAAAERLIPAFLELGGKDPLIVTGTADLERAATAALRGATLSSGQACQSIERVYVHQSVLGEFVDLLVQKAEAVRLNHPDIASGEIGPIIFEKQADIIRLQIEDARRRGAKVLTGGTIETLDGGLWLRPTVLVDVNHDMKVMREETFGPVIPVMGYKDEDDAVNLANDSEYGLSAAVIAGTLEEAERIARRINAGAVSLNDAALTSLFHEAEKHSFKLSGLGGSRMGPAGFQRFLRRKALIAQHGEPLPLSAFSEDQ
ncbi:aldehyde dehydrogenase family protein [Parvularcula lutaonensis]|uniref:Aldehyde dehydrogenase family protein n=1 Tax=Parvularcula lutaonensis TaxID=491923 RepID=A0ABV7MCB8_9PROT|nr:aldehyde dehydrogenase family protein [Parvularcula lutaonensis]GGY38713.1 hypothetical protein GCM10007148_03800 [Parvularcula lutaonensis]